MSDGPGGSAYAAELASAHITMTTANQKGTWHKDVARYGPHARHLKDLLQPTNGDRPGFLVAGGACGTCGPQKPEFVMDWIRALVRGFPPTPV